MNNIKEYFEKIKIILGIKPPDKDGTGTDIENTPDGDVMNARQLENQVFESFKVAMEKLTTDMSLLFPTYFMICLHTDDYNELHERFKWCAQDYKKRCLIEVRKQLAIHPEGKDYVRHSNYWRIQFVEFKEGCLLNQSDGKPIKRVARGHATIETHLYPPDLGSTATNISTNSGRIVTTYTTKGTLSAPKIAINHEAFKDVTEEGVNSFRLEFIRSDIEGNGRGDHAPERPRPTGYDGVPKPQQKQPNTVSSDKTTGMLKIHESFFKVNDQRTDTFVMTTDFLQVTGPNATSSPNGAEILKIDNDGIMNPHLNIKFDAPNKRFIISAVGETKLNDRILERNPNNWSELPNNSTILLNGDIQINFTKK